jgi:hypothetical protein
LAVANGGTGQNNAVSALNALLPSQSGNTNYVLKTDGAGVVSWTPNTALAVGNYGAISVTSAAPGPTSWSINNGYVTPAMLTTGGPSWNSSGLVTASNYTADGGATSTLTLVSSGINYTVSASGGSGGDLTLGTPSGNTMSVPNTGGAGIEATGPYVNTSDATLKENVEAISDCLNILSQIEGVYYNWKADKNKVRQAGVIAQDVQKVLPEAVTVTTSKKLGVAYSSLIPVLINAIKELEARIAALEAKV